MTASKQQGSVSNGWPVYAGGVDGGNSFAKGVIFLRGKPTIVSIPSVTMAGTLQGLITSRSSGGALSSTRVSDILSPDEYVLKREEREEHYIGGLALSEGYSGRSGRGDERRYWNGRLLDLVCVLSGSVIPETDYNLSLVTGLPGTVYSNQRNIDKVTLNLKGEHTFILNGRTRHICIDVIKVVQEGAAASIAIHTNHDDEEHALIDIGGYSTEYYAFRKMRPISSLCQATNTGVEQIGDTLLHQLQQEYGMDATLSPRQRYSILLAYSSRGTLPYPVVRYDREVVPSRLIEQWADYAAQKVTERLMEFIGPYWNQGDSGKLASQFASVTLIGGGAQVLKRHIATYITKPITPRQPETANAFSYALIANHLLAQQRQSA